MLLEKWQIENTPPAHLLYQLSQVMYWCQSSVVMHMKGWFLLDRFRPN